SKSTAAKIDSITISSEFFDNADYYGNFHSHRPSGDGENESCGVDANNAFHRQNLQRLRQARHGLHKERHVYANDQIHQATSDTADKPIESQTHQAATGAAL